MARGRQSLKSPCKSIQAPSGRPDRKVLRVYEPIRHEKNWWYSNRVDEQSSIASNHEGVVDLHIPWGGCFEANDRLWLIHVSVPSWVAPGHATDLPRAFLPDDFLQETLATIYLLIPCTKPSANGWLEHEIEWHNLDRNLWHRDPPVRNKSRFPYWQDRLLDIEEAFDKSKPRSFPQWWHDTRDMQQWWGFWLLVVGIFLTVLFGLIQSVTGILQLFKS